MVKVLYEEKNIIKTFKIESNKTILDLSRIENPDIGYNELNNGWTKQSDISDFKVYRTDATNDNTVSFKITFS